MSDRENPSSLAELSKSYGPPPDTGPPPVAAPNIPEASFELNRPSKQDVRVALGIDPDVDEDVQDIDPGQWLSHDDSNVYGYINTRAGRIRIAALSESELDNCRKLSTKDKQPGRPQAGKEINTKRLRLWVVAYSMNKAYNLWKQPGELSAELIDKNNKLSGEITMIVNRITELSGFKDEVPGGDSSFFSVS